MFTKYKRDSDSGSINSVGPLWIRGPASFCLRGESRNSEADLSSHNRPRGVEASLGRRARSSLGALPAGFDRRFEAVILWSTHSRVSTRVTQDLLALHKAGMAV